MADDPPPKRRPGRPSLKEGEATVNLQLRLAESDYNEACRIAKQHRASVSDVLRAAFRIAKRQDRFAP